MKINRLALYPPVADQLEKLAVRLTHASRRVRDLAFASQELAEIDREIDWLVATEPSLDERVFKGVTLNAKLKKAVGRPDLYPAKEISALRRRVYIELLGMDPAVLDKARA